MNIDRSEMKMHFEQTVALMSFYSSLSTVHCRPYRRIVLQSLNFQKYRFYPCCFADYY